LRFAGPSTKVDPWVFQITALTVVRRRTMSKGMDRKKEAKKKPAKSLQEKRAAKREKKQSRGFQV